MLYGAAKRCRTFGVILACFVVIANAPGKTKDDTLDAMLAKCVGLYQSLHHNEAEEYAAVESSMKVCGAAPSCSVCAVMRSGDCKYIFPTNVVIYSKSDVGGRKLCACQTFACSLPWDPAGWSRSCMTELGCLPLREYTNSPEFPEALCSVNGKTLLRFVPLTFSRQSYNQPGVAAILEKRGQQLNVTYKHLHYAHGEKKGTQQVRRTDAVQNSAASNTLVIELEQKKHKYVFDVIKYRDEICIRKPQTRAQDVTDGALEETCMPIPEPVMPRFYVRKSTANGGNSGKTDYEQALHVYDNKGTQHEGKDGLILGLRNAAVYEAIDKKSSHHDKCKTKSCDTTDSGVKNCSDDDIFAVRFNGFARLFDHAQTAHAVLERWTNKGDCRFAGAHTAGEKIGSVQELREGKAQAESKCEYGVRVKEDSNSSRTNETGEKLSGTVLCITSVPADSEYEVLRSDACTDAHGCGSRIKSDLVSNTTSRLRVKKRKKMLRRYVLVQAKGQERYVRCDDTYSLDLSAMTQQDLNRAMVKDNRFVFPTEDLMHSTVEDSQDPCQNPLSRIVYFYESSGFTKSSDRRQCGSPIAEYYEENKKTEGCVYDYVRTDNYQPLSFGSNDVRNISIVPLSSYEQGMCIDGFTRTLYRPRYRTKSSGHSNTGNSSCFFKETVDREHYVKSEFSYGIDNGGKKCRFYKIEAWGGGEAAGYADDRVTKRSGRPGQYVVAVLDFKKFYSKASDITGNTEGIPNGFLTSCKDGKCSHGDKSYALIMQIGQGGEKGDSLGGKGRDTVVKLCITNPSDRSDDMWVLDSDVRQYRLAAGGARGKEMTAEETRCLEILRAVGGGSEKIGEPKYNVLIDHLMTYYHTIVGDVLSSDEYSGRYLRDGHAMFTRFPLEVNMPPVYTGDMDDILDEKAYFDGRALPPRLCRKKANRSDINSEYPYVPGMGGCWGETRSADGNVQTSTSTQNGKTSPGVGENGAVIITCEQWDDVADPQPSNVKPLRIDLTKH